MGKPLAAVGNSTSEPDTECYTSLILKFASLVLIVKLETIKTKQKETDNTESQVELLSVTWGNP